MAKPNVSAYKSFEQITDRLDEIVGQVRDKDVSLERSLDLFDEAIALGSKAVDLVDTTDFTPEEEARLVQAAAEKDAAAAADKGDGSPEDAAEKGEAAEDGASEAGPDADADADQASTGEES